MYEISDFAEAVKKDFGDKLYIYEHKFILQLSFAMSSIKKIKSILLAVFLISLSFVNGQSISERYNRFGEVIVTHLSNSPFPHYKRANGHTYNNKAYSFEEHYNDSTVLIFIPKGFQPKDKNDFMIHFHGWDNNVDSVLSQFKLIEQFTESGKNAILVVPQGPKNAPDSFGGKLEDENGFLRFMTDVVHVLHEREVIRSKSMGNIILSGHSGGYRVISFILLRGGLTQNIKEVYLFDGLYGQIEKYTYWLDRFNGKFVNIYTKDGGTKDQSENLMECFDAWNMPYIFKNEADLTEEDLRVNRIINIYSDLGHNEVIHVRSQFMNYLRTSCLLKK